MALIKCPKCENEISDQCGTCPHCGEIIKKPESVEQPETNTVEVADILVDHSKIDSKSKKSPWTIVGLAVGIVAIIVGLAIVFTSSDTLSSASFGGDFYTYTYRGIRAVETAVCALTKAVGALIAVIGGITVCKFGTEL